MENKLPFYMAYPVPLLYNDDRNARRDYDYMKSIYPDTAKRVLPYMEEECDRMEYDGSMMYDEYPDRLQLRLMCRRIYDKAEKEEENPGAWLMDLIEVMTCAFTRSSTFRKPSGPTSAIISFRSFPSDS